MLSNLAALAVLFTSTVKAVQFCQFCAMVCNLPRSNFVLSLIFSFWNLFRLLFSVTESVMGGLPLALFSLSEKVKFIVTLADIDGSLLRTCPKNLQIESRIWRERGISSYFFYDQFEIFDTPKILLSCGLQSQIFPHKFLVEPRCHSCIGECT